MSQYLQNNNEGHSKNSKGENPNIDIITMKNIKKAANNILTQRTIKRATAVVIIKNHITTPVPLEIRPGKGNATINVTISYKKILLCYEIS